MIVDLEEDEIRALMACDCELADEEAWERGRDSLASALEYGPSGSVQRAVRDLVQGLVIEGVGIPEAKQAVHAAVDNLLTVDRIEVHGEDVA